VSGNAQEILAVTAHVENAQHCDHVRYGNITIIRCLFSSPDGKAAFMQIDGSLDNYPLVLGARYLKLLIPATMLFRLSFPMFI
jgi:hypothetical protein